MLKCEPAQPLIIYPYGTDACSTFVFSAVVGAFITCKGLVRLYGQPVGALPFERI